MRIDVIAEMDLTPADDAAIGRLLTGAFGGGFDGRSFHKQRHHLRIVARDADDAILGHVALLIRDIRVGDRLTPVIGVAEVATREDHRGQGIAAALLGEALSQARRSLADFVVLFGNRPIYAGMGFTAAANPLTYVMLDGARSHGRLSRSDDTLMVLPLRDADWDHGADVDLVGHIF